MSPDLTTPWGCTWDVLVVGAGAAGLMAALELPDQLQVLVVAKNSLHANASRLAQAGIAIASQPADSLDSHVEDTLHSGAGLCDERVVHQLIAESPACFERLQALGIKFDQHRGQLTPGLAGGHSHPRLLHVKDRTGSALMDSLEHHVRQRPQCTLLYDVDVLQLWIQEGCCIGAQALWGNELGWIRAESVVLATGGGGYLFAQTTTPRSSTGDGINLAWHAGAALRDLEFVQFHPTALKLEGAPQVLISEAVRGAGARVLDGSGSDLLASLPAGALARRDQICQRMDQAMRHHHVDCLWLDLRSISHEQLDQEFHTIVGQCRSRGINPFDDLVPIAPAAHYWIGGIEVDLDGATSVPGLYAIGEVASTGFHGANRLAGNSLLECLVLARRFARHHRRLGSGSASKQRLVSLKVLPIDCPRTREQILNQIIGDTREICWNSSGIARDALALGSAVDHFSILLGQDHHFLLLNSILSLRPGDYWCHAERDLVVELVAQVELRNHLQLAYLLARAAHFREESRGCHFRLDAPVARDQWRVHTLQRRGSPICAVPP